MQHRLTVFRHKMLSFYLPSHQIQCQWYYGNNTDADCIDYVVSCNIEMDILALSTLYKVLIQMFRSNVKYGCNRSLNSDRQTGTRYVFLQCSLSELLGSVKYHIYSKRLKFLLRFFHNYIYECGLITDRNFDQIISGLHIACWVN